MCFDGVCVHVCVFVCVCVCVCVKGYIYMPWSAMAGPKDIHIFRRYNLKSTAKQFFRVIVSIILPLVVYENFSCSTETFQLSVLSVFFNLAILIHL